MARLLVGDTDIPMRVYELIAEQLQLNVTLEPYPPATPRAPGPVESFVDVVRERLQAGHLPHIHGTNPAGRPLPRGET